MMQNLGPPTLFPAGSGTESGTSSAIRAEGLVKHFGETVALDGLDLTVRSGSVLGVLGPNGAGKTTLVRVLSTLVAPDEGRATVAGLDVVAEADEVRRLIGLTGQYASVDDGLTGTENLVLIGRLLGLSRRRSGRRADELLERFSLTEASGRPARTYSGGMRRRLDLAASLVGDPQLLFLDEPTTGLDPRSRMDLWEIVRGLVAEGVTILLTTQYLEEADALADDIVVVDRGRVIAQGTPDELKATTGTQMITVRPREGSELPRVRQLVSEVTGGAAEVVNQLVSVRVSDPATLPVVVARLAGAGIVVDELALRRSSLDEVFLALTGRPVPPDGSDDIEGAVA